MKQIDLEGVLFSQVVNILRSVKKAKITKKPLVKDKDQNIQYCVDSDLIKYKYKTQPIDATEDAKIGKNQVQKNQTHNIISKDSLGDHNIVLILILTVLKITLYDKGV